MYWIFISISTTMSDDSDQSTIKGYTTDHFYHPFEMHLWKFSITSESKILYENVEVPVNKSECVKALSQSYSKNTKFLPVKVDEVFPNLVAYEFKGCCIQEIGYRNFKNLWKLQLINLESNQISAIPTNTFNDTPILKYLYLRSNQLTYIDENIFKPLKMLKSLDLQGNKITFVSKFAFRALSDLRRIFLSDNLLQTLEDAHFRNNRKIEKILIKNNSIRYLSPTMFNGKRNLDVVNLKYNSCINGEFCYQKNTEQRPHPSFVYKQGFKPVINDCEFSFDELIEKIMNDC